MLRKIFDRYQETFPKSPTSMAINLIATFIFIYSLTIIKDHNIPDVYAGGKGYVASYFPQDERPSALPEANCRPSWPIIFPISVKETFQ
jgi:hypothetical protein